MQRNLLRQKTVKGTSGLTGRVGGIAGFVKNFTDRRTNVNIDKQCNASSKALFFAVSCIYHILIIYYSSDSQTI